MLHTVLNDEKVLVRSYRLRRIRNILTVSELLCAILLYTLGDLIPLPPQVNATVALPPHILPILCRLLGIGAFLQALITFFSWDNSSIAIGINHLVIDTADDTLIVAEQDFISIGYHRNILNKLCRDANIELVFTSPNHSQATSQKIRLKHISNYEQIIKTCPFKAK